MTFTTTPRRLAKTLALAAGMSIVSMSAFAGGDAALYGLGALTEERWQAFFDVTSQAGVYEAGLNWRDAFTDNYLPGRG